MLNPVAAPDALSAAAEPLLDLFQDCNHEPFIELLHVVPVTGMTPGTDRMQGLAQAVHDAGGWAADTRWDTDTPARLPPGLAGHSPSAGDQGVHAAPQNGVRAQPPHAR